jgi:NAD(P)-dependent dehydrogenase (short-subunit alcohol dehydrogenase family)
VRPNWKQQQMEMLKNKVAVVFAAPGQIAGAVARSFAQHGAKVYVIFNSHIIDVDCGKPNVL